MHPNSAIPKGARRPMTMGLLVGALLIAIAAPVQASRVPTNPEPDIACHPDHGTGLLTSYVTTVETPAGGMDWFVQVDFTLSGSDVSCELSLATYELPAGTFSLPQALFDADHGTFGPGSHTLTAALPRDGDLPGCHAQYDFAFGPPIQQLDATNRYGDRQIRARIVGSSECPVEGAAPTQGPQRSSPREDTQGGNPTPTPAEGTLPDTAMPAAGASWLTGILAVILMTSLGTLALRLRRTPPRSR